MIQVFQPSLGAEELAAVERVFASNWIGRGERVAEFEAAWAAHIGVPAENVVATTCATEGLFTAIESLEIGGWDREVILPSISFVGAANAIKCAVADIVFCDVDPHTLNPTIEHIEPLVKMNAHALGLILSHYGGIPCQIRKWMLPYHVALIEDCACAPASVWDSWPAGSKADVAVWSMDAMKILSAGDGGMIYFADKELADRTRKLLYLGMDSESGLSSNKDQWWTFGVVDPTARRAIMNDITAAVLLEQLKKLPSFVARRRQVHEAYNELLVGEDWLRLPPPIPANVQSSYYFYWVQAEKTETRDALARYLRENDIYTTFRYHPLHRVRAYGQTDRKLPGADYAADHTLLLPLHQSLSDNDVQYVAEKVKEFGRGRQVL